MTLVKQLRDALALADLASQRQSMGIKGGKAALHQVITGPGAAQQAGDYARELISRGILKNTPVTLDCDQPMSDDMVQRAFKDAKNSMLIVDNIEHLSRHESLVALATRAVDDGKCIVVLCGEKRGIDKLFAGEPDMQKRFTSRFDMGDSAVLLELAQREEQARTEAVERMTTVQTPVQPMRPLKFFPKPD